jgi:hypothetical protein
VAAAIPGAIEMVEQVVAEALDRRAAAAQAARGD